MKKSFRQWWKGFIADDINKVGIGILIAGSILSIYALQFIVL